MVIDGEGACPHKDGSGNCVWVEDLRKLCSGTIHERNDVLSEIAYPLNYKGAPVTVNFDADNFDLVRARELRLGVEQAQVVYLCTPRGGVSAAATGSTEERAEARADVGHGRRLGT